MVGLLIEINMLQKVFTTIFLIHNKCMRYFLNHLHIKRCEWFDDRRPNTGAVYAAGEAFVCYEGNQSLGSALPSKPVKQFIWFMDAAC